MGKPDVRSRSSCYWPCGRSTPWGAGRVTTTVAKLDDAIKCIESSDALVYISVMVPSAQGHPIAETKNDQVVSYANRLLVVIKKASGVGLHPRGLLSS